MSSPALQLSVVEGRLIEIRGRGVLTLPGFAAFRTSFTDALMKVGGRAVLMADLRGLSVQDASVYDALLRLMRTDSPVVERVAYAIEAGSLLAQNVKRVADEAGNPARRVCFALDEAVAWLTPVLSPSERTRLAAFVAG